MFTKRLLAAGFGFFSGVMLTAGSAHAISIADSLFLGELNQWSDDSAEAQNVDVNLNGFLDVDDTLRGTFEIDSVTDQSGGGGQVAYGTGSANNELSGIFEIVVTSKVFVSNGIDGAAGTGDDVFNYTFGAYAPFQGEFGLSGSTMVVFFEDATPDYTRTGTIAAAEASATADAKVLEIGFTGDADESWSAQAIQDPSLGATVAQGTGLGVFNFSLGFLVNTLFNANIEVFAGCNPLCPGDGLVDINASGGVSGTLGSTTEYDIFDNVDLVFRPVQIPEPGTIGMLGMGLLGLGFFLRTRQRKGVA